MSETAEIVKALQAVMDPELDRSIVDLDFIKRVDVYDKKAVIHFQPDSIHCPFLDNLVAQIKQAVLNIDGIAEVEVKIQAGKELQDAEYFGLNYGGVQQLNRIQTVIAVMSGKGGVGKSLVSGLLATHLNRRGHSVGILDADITGPSIPKMFFAERPEVEYSPRATLPSVTRSGIRVMSINLLLPDEGQAVIWRGPLVGRAIKQFWTDTLWGALDFLIVDLPPGTSDAPLTVMQSLPMSGVLLVTSPQELAGMVVRKAAGMARQIGIPMLGLIENMSFFRAPDSGKEYNIFGNSHAEETARALEIPLLARLPIDAALTALCDQGRVEEYLMAEFEKLAGWVETNSPKLQPPKMAD